MERESTHGLILTHENPGRSVATSWACRALCGLEPLSIEEVDLAPPGPGEVLVRVRAAGLCHSDLSVIDGNRPRPLPMVLGHEMAGVVEEVGADVTDLQRGDHVVAAFVPSCGHCAPCAAGRPALCEPGLAANTAGTLAVGRAPAHQHGTTAESSPWRVGLCRIRHPVAPLAGAGRSRHCPSRRRPCSGARSSRVSAPSSTPRRCRKAAAPPSLDSAASAWPRCWRPACSKPVDRRDRPELTTSSRLARAPRRHGRVNAADPDCADKVREVTGGGVAYAFEMAGSARALELAYRITRRGGTTVSAGLPHPQQQISPAARQPRRRGAHA